MKNKQINEYVFIICIEGKNPKTEKNVFDNFINNNYSKFLSIDHFSNSKEMPNNVYQKIKTNFLNIEKINSEYKNYILNVFIIHDGDSNHDMQSLSWTTNKINEVINSLVKQSNKGINLVIDEIYDDGLAFEFFIALILDKFPNNFKFDDTDKIRQKCKEVIDYKTNNKNPITDMKEKLNLSDTENILEIICEKLKGKSKYYEVFSKLLKAYKICFG